MPVLEDGFKTIISIGSATLAEKEVTPPGYDGGGEIDTTTMRNTAWRTKAAKSLKTLTEVSFVAAYDPAQFTTLLTVVNLNQEITVTFPDLSTIKFWGYLDKFIPNANVEGEQPTAQCTIICTNVNGSNAETAPVYAAAP